MSFRSAIALGAILGAKTALGHGLVSGVTTDGQYNQGYILDYYYAKQNAGSFPDVAGWYAENLDNGFVDGTEYDQPNIICHKQAAPGAATATVSAGGTVEFHWTSWPESHFGPVLTYVAPCGGDCSAVDKATLKWTKIEEAAIDLTTQEWPIAAMIANNNTWVTTVPENLLAGSYVFRHEIIAMHGAGSPNGAQNYPQCINIEVTGSGTELPEGVVGTELYKPDDAGIVFNPYSTLSSYEIPGPALPDVFGGSGSGSPQPAPTSGATPSASAAPPSVSAPASSAAPEPTAAPSPVTTGTPSSSASAAPVVPTSTPEVPSTPELPETFTLETFIEWLRSTAGSNSATTLRRRHARAML
jgi:cellulase